MSEIISSGANGIQPTTTTWDYWQLVKTAVGKGDLGEVDSRLRQWRADTSIAGPSAEQIDYLVPEAARDNGQPEILEYLLSLGGKIGTHAISLARSPGMFEVFEAHGWEVDDSILRSNVRHPDLVAFFLSKGVDPNSNPNGFSILDIAALSGPLESVEILFNHGASIEPSSSALHTAAQGDAPDRIPIMDYLLKQGADVNSIAADITGPSEARRSGRK
ncbi:MAG: hypothetical protein Q9198_006946, partial [Flavoplaca austrocitrina]